MQDTNQLKKMYDRGENLIQYLTRIEGVDKTNAIRISYEIQAGYYIQIYKNDGSKKREYCEKLAVLYTATPQTSAKTCVWIPKQRIDQHGYVKFLATHSTELGLNVIRNEVFGLSLNSLNPTGTTIVQSHSDGRESATPTFQCPISGQPLTKWDDALWGSGGYAFPIIGGIPCILQENAVLASHFSNE